MGYTSIKAFVLEPRLGVIISPMPYLFETRSDNSSDNIYTELVKIWTMTGGKLNKIPFCLSVKMIDTVIPVNGKTENRKFPIWSLQCAFTTTNSILEAAERLSLPTNAENAIQLSLPEPEDADIDQCVIDAIYAAETEKELMTVYDQHTSSFVDYDQREAFLYHLSQRKGELRG